MVESIYDELKSKYITHPKLSHIGNVRDKDFNKNIKSEYIDEIQKNLHTLCKIHQNQSAVVFGAGPSLLDYKEIDDGSFIRVSCNRQIFREEILPFHLYINVDGGAGRKHSYATEFKEEIDQSIRIIKQLNTFENMFFYNGKNRHEFVSLFQMFLCWN